MKNKLLACLAVILCLLCLNSCFSFDISKPRQTENQIQTEANPTEESVAVNETEAAEEAIEETVWIPTRGGVKYHSNPKCSGMISPKKATISEAAMLGFKPCSKCY